MRMNCTSEGRRFSKKRSICCLYKTNQLLSSKSGMQWRAKASAVMKRKACNIVSTNLGLQNDAKNV